MVVKQVSVLVLLLAVAWVAPTWAHDFWIMPSTFTPAPGEEVQFNLHRGQDFAGESLPRIDRWFTRFDLLDADGNTTAVGGELGDEPAGESRLPGPGNYQVVYEGTRNFTDLGPEKFRHYLEDEGMTAAIRERERRGETGQNATEYFSRMPKAILQVGPAGQGALAKPSGQPLELVPLDDLSLLRPGAAVRVRVLYHGRPLPDIQLMAYSDRHPQAKLKTRTDDDGVAEIVLPEDGVWLLKSVHLVRLPEGGRAQWESLWAIMTFRMGAGAPGAALSAARR